MKESPQRLTKFICGLRKCHIVCSSIWEVSFVMTSLNLMLLTRKCFRWIHLWLNFSFSFIGEKINKRPRTSIRFASLKLSKHKIVLKTAHDIFEPSQELFQKIRCPKSVFCTKMENWYYLKYNCNRPLRQDCGIARMNLNSRTDSIMLTMLVRMRLTCCVLPQGNALSVRV